MKLQNSQNVAVGFVLISAYWIFLGVYFLSLITSQMFVFQVIFLTFFGLFFLVLGWGLMNSMAFFYQISFFCSIGGSFLSFMVFMIVFSELQFSPVVLISLLSVLCIPAAWYHQKYNVIVTGSYTLAERRICPECFKNIPFDAKMCPYCEKEFQDFFDKE
jgi:hypothetical protein